MTFIAIKKARGKGHEIMKKTKLSLLVIFMAAVVAGCSAQSQTGASVAETATETESVENQTGEVEVVDGIATESEAEKVFESEVTNPKEAIERLVAGNQYFIEKNQNPSEFSVSELEDLAENGQNPFAVILTCSDSRVPPEHIFSTGFGDLFVIRTAGNVVDDFELGSIEYGAEHLGAKVVVVMGHTNCGAVSAALDGHASGNIQSIVDEVVAGIGEETDPTAAEDKNITHSWEKIMESEMINELVEAGELKVVEAKYDIATGQVVFMDPEQ